MHITPSSTNHKICRLQTIKICQENTYPHNITESRAFGIWKWTHRRMIFLDEEPYEEEPLRRVLWWKRAVLLISMWKSAVSLISKIEKNHDFCHTEWEKVRLVFRHVLNEWVLIATCKHLVWSTQIGRNMPIWIPFICKIYGLILSFRLEDEVHYSCNCT